MHPSSFDVTHFAGLPVIRVGGSFDGRTVSGLCSALRKALTTSRRVVVDATGSFYMSRPALAAFLSYIAATRDAGTDVRLAVQERVYGAFDTLGFPSLFRLHRSVEEAIDSFGSEDPASLC